MFWSSISYYSAFIDLYRIYIRKCSQGGTCGKKFDSYQHDSKMSLHSVAPWACVIYTCGGHGRKHLLRGFGLRRLKGVCRISIPIHIHVYIFVFVLSKRHIKEFWPVINIYMYVWEVSFSWDCFTIFDRTYSLRL